MIFKDFSSVGCQKNFPALQERSVADFAIHPNTGQNLATAVQQVIDELGQQGGGLLRFGEGEYCFDSPIRLDHDQLILAGCGAATRLRLRSAQTQIGRSPWLSPALITAGTRLQSTDKFWGVKPARQLQKNGQFATDDLPVTGDIQEAPYLTDIVSIISDQEFAVAETKQLNPGDFVLITMRNSNDDSDLLKHLLGITTDFHPLQRGALLAGPSRAASFQYLAEISAIENNQVRLTSPLPEALELRFSPALYAAPLLRNIGVADMTLICDWRGPYQHHGGHCSPPAVSNEMDYGWNAVKFFRCAHSFIRQVTIEDFTSGIELIDCRNVTAQNIIISDNSDHGGHYGVKVYCHCSDNLFKDIQLKAYRTHAISCEGNAYNNVFKRFTVDDGDGLQVSEFDLHGFADLPFAPPGHNLFEDITGIGRITGGGGKFNLPHAGRGNIFSNVQFNLRDDELFYSWISVDTGTPDYQQFPGTILSGVYDPRRKIQIDGKQNAQQNSWLTIQQLNCPADKKFYHC